jgi:hypothetical protein
MSALRRLRVIVCATAACTVLPAWLAVPARAADAQAGQPVVQGGAGTDAGSSQTPGPDPVVQAVWKPQEFEFYYQSFTTFYSCNSLEDKLRRYLRALGADPATRVRVTGCEFGAQIARMPIAYITTMSPVEATPEALAELERTRPQRELAARVRNDRAKGIDLLAPFPAHWERVSLSRGELGIESGDCELIEQLNRRLLPLLAVRVAEVRLQCMRGLSGINRPKLEVDALKQLPTADEAGAKDKKKRKKST